MNYMPNVYTQGDTRTFLRAPFGFIENGAISAGRESLDLMDAEPVATRRAGAFWYVETTVPDKPGAALVNAFEQAGMVAVRPGPLRVMLRSDH